MPPGVKEGKDTGPKRHPRAIRVEKMAQFFDSEDESCIFLRNISWLSPDYRALLPSRQTSYAPLWEPQILHNLSIVHSPCCSSFPVAFRGKLKLQFFPEGVECGISSEMNIKINPLVPSVFRHLKCSSLCYLWEVRGVNDVQCRELRKQMHVGRSAVVVCLQIK
jgi:hypothetical protein